MWLRSLIFWPGCSESWYLFSKVASLENTADPGRYSLECRLWFRPHLRRWLGHPRTIIVNYSLRSITWLRIRDRHGRYDRVNFFWGYSQHQTLLKLNGDALSGWLNLALSPVGVESLLLSHSKWSWQTHWILSSFSLEMLWICPRRVGQASCVASGSYAIAINVGCGSLESLQQKALAYVSVIQQPENCFYTVGKSDSIPYANYHNGDRSSGGWEACRSHRDPLNCIGPA